MWLIATCIPLNRPVQPAQALHPVINHKIPCGNCPVRFELIFTQIRMFPTCCSIMESGQAGISDAQRELLENAFQHDLVANQQPQKTREKKAY